MTTNTKTFATLANEYRAAVEAYFAAAKAHAALDCYKENPLAAERANMIAAERALHANEAERRAYLSTNAK